MPEEIAWSCCARYTL
uniref:Uncharacterized protein n=1 Tax=Arundo donax TaxID=35708 RepID=A0A0A9F905_ARUDO